MSKIPIEKYELKEDSYILLDTNILLHLFYPTLSQNKDMVDYESLWGKISSKKTSLLLPAIQISEFINRCIRFQYMLYKADKEPDYDYKKDYRNTEDYRENMKSILNIVTGDILPLFTIICDNFDTIPPDKLYIYGFSYDFNDALLVGIAEKYKADIITHDADFANFCTKINFISGNKKLLMFS